MPKERNFNPVQAQRKADKAKAIKKGKAEVTSRRNEQLARRDPQRILAQITDLKKIPAAGGKLTRHEEQVLGGLEKEHKAVTRARDALGERAPALRAGGGRDGGVLGKRRRGGEADEDDSSESDVADEVRRIPMPRDTPPPIPKEVLDGWWARRRARRARSEGGGGGGGGGSGGGGTSANAEPLRERDGRPKLVEAAPVEAKTVYEAKPVIRDLRKEAVSAFVPTAVRMKIDKGMGKGGLLEPEEADELEREGYLKTGGGASGALPDARNVTMEEVDDEDG